MKVGVIGAGYWGRKHVTEFKNIGVNVLAADLDEKKLEEFKEDALVETTTDYKKILKDQNIKAVTICAPNKYHFALAKECMHYGKHILVEKPISESVEEAKELVNMAKEKKLILMVGHIYRFNNAIEKVKELIKNSSLGKIRIVKIRWINDEYTFQPDFDKRVGDRDVITDLAVHPYDILHYLFGKNPDYIFCNGSSYHIKNKIEAITIIGKLDEIMLQIELSWITPPKTRLLEVIGEKKSLFVECVTQKISVFEKGNLKKIDIKGNNTISTELKYFLDLVNKKQANNKSSGEVGLEVVKMLKLTRDALKR